MTEIEKFVDDTYLKILQRHADDEGLQVYTEHILEGRLQREDLERILRESAEYMDKLVKQDANAKVPFDNLPITKGSATIISGNTSIIVTHGFGATPSVIIVTPKTNEGVNFYVTNKTSTQFTTNIQWSQEVDCEYEWICF